MKIPKTCGSQSVEDKHYDFWPQELPKDFGFWKNRCANYREWIDDRVVRF